MLRLDYHPLTPDTWDSLQQLFGIRGACGGCWCMYWRLKNKDYEINKGNKNKQLLYDRIEKRHPLGVLAFLDNEPVGWCSVAPRETLVRLESSRLFKRIDEQPVWSITCLFIKKELRRKGLTKRLIEAACAYARKKGARTVEGYPLLPKNDKIPDVFAYVGFGRTFEEAGFKEVHRPSETRTFQRKQL